MQPTRDTSGFDDGGDVIPLSSIRRFDVQNSRHFALLREIIDTSAAAAGVRSAAQDILDVVTDSLGLSSGTISLLRLSSEGHGQLVPVASSGTQAPFLRKMPPIDVQSSYEAAVVFVQSQPRYVADLHGADDTAMDPMRAEDAEAVGRWRDLIRTKSYAVLPLGAAPRSIGVMTLQWPDSREFEPHMTEVLETIAAVATVALEARTSPALQKRPSTRPAHAASEGLLPSAAAAAEVAGDLAATPEAAPQHPHTPVGPLRLEVTSDGVLMPLSPDAAPSGEGLLEFEVTLADAACVVWDASTPHPAIVAVLIASFGDAETADALRDRLVQAKRVCSRQDMTTAQTMSLLNGVVVASAAAGVAVPAWLGWIDARTGALSHCGAGETDIVVHGADGRTWNPQLSVPPLGSSGTVACGQDHRLLLPGDRVMVRLGDAEIRIARP